MYNPFGMDEGCTNCPALVESRRSIVHGYGDVSAEFLFVLEAPDRRTDRRGHPISEDGPLADILRRVGFLTGQDDVDGSPVLENAFVSHLTRCRHPDRPPEASEVHRCDPFLTAEVRSINPELLVPVGQRALTVLAREYTTRDVAGLAVAEVHGTPLRGRGFELLPMVGLDALTSERIESYIDAMEETMNRDYRQTKGRRGR